MGVMLITGFASCTKDGVYTPKKKISTIYLESKTTSTVTATGISTSRSVPKYKSQEWIWDGNLLKEIRHFDTDGTTIRSTTTYTYNGKQLTRIDTKTTDIEYYMTFEYDGKWLKSSMYYANGKLLNATTYTHTDKKISSYETIRYGYYDYSSDKAAEIDAVYKEMMKPCGFVIPSSHAHNATKGTSESKETVELTWTDNNITSVTTTTDGGKSSIALTYDEMKNPYYGLYNDEPYTPSMASENNLLSTTSPEEPVSTYTYEKKYPVTQTMQYTTSLPAMTTVSEITYTYTYQK